MARQVLENGVILPAEYSDDWYDDMTSNLTKLDDVIGSDSEKLSSADVGAAALSNNYNDLDNLPTIPTVNDATLTIQKNGEDVQTFTANASSNVTCNITVPTKTSDLTNDSNFVDTSNAAVASGITSAKVTDYDSHIADTDIHVTTADKNKWNNGVTQSYVFRYSSTALVASSTNSNTLLDNTDNLKVGDKVIDSDGVLFSITAIDTVNSTFTVGSALIDLAQDSDVVHKSGNETVGGSKTFTNSIILQNSDTSGLSRDLSSKSQVAVLGDAVSSDNTKYRFVDKNNNEICYIRQRKLTNSNTDMSFCVNNIDNDNNSISAEINFVIDKNNDPRIIPSVTDSISLGRQTFRWKNIYSNQINGLTPSSLSLPDINNRIDISSYITNLSNVGNEYTPSVNGWICIRSGNATKISVLDVMTSVGNASVSNTATYLTVMTPVIANRKVYINVICTSLEHAYFIPCQGNV